MSEHELEGLAKELGRTPEEVVEKARRVVIVHQRMLDGLPPLDDEERMIRDALTRIIVDREATLAQARASIKKRRERRSP